MKTLRERVEASVLTIGALAVAASALVSPSCGRATGTLRGSVAAADRTTPARDLRAEDRLCLDQPSSATCHGGSPRVPPLEGSTAQRSVSR
jgi:hypothetical protein